MYDKNGLSGEVAVSRVAFIAIHGSFNVRVSASIATGK